MSSEHENLDPRRKRLLWRASHRGIREMDLIFGGFVAAGITGFTEAELTELEAMIEIPDQQLLGWAMHQEEIPAGQATTLLRNMLNYRPF